MFFKTLYYVCVLFILSACGSSSDSSSTSSSTGSSYTADEAMSYFKSDLSSNSPTSVRYVADDCSYDLNGYGDNFLVSCLAQTSDLSNKWGIATISSLVESSNGTNTLSNAFTAYTVTLKDSQALGSISNSYTTEFVTGYYESNGYICDGTKCSITAANSDITTCIISTQTCTFVEYVHVGLSIDLRIFAKKLRTQYMMEENLPSLPTISSNYANNAHADYISGENDLYTVIAYADAWDGTTEVNKSAVRLPTCIETSGSTGTCYAFVSDTEIQECNWVYPSGGESCTAYTTIPNSLLKLIRAQHDYHGFNYATEKGYNFTKNVIIVDDGFEPTHALHGDKYQSLNIVFDDDTNKSLSLDDALGRISGTDWANVLDARHHGSSTSSILSFEGPNIEAWNIKLGYDTTILDKITTDVNSIVSFAYGIEAVALPNQGSFILPAGNNNENWSENVKEVGFYNANLASQDRYLIVGAISQNGSLASFSGIAGSNVQIQKRFLVALGEDMLIASTIAGTKNFITTGKGTSYAEPLVAKAHSLLSSVCSGSSNASLMQLLLDNANTAFDDYSAENFGMGILDVKAALQYIESNSCP